MSCDVLVDLSPLDTSSRFTGTGRYAHELGLALAALSAGERRNLNIVGLTAIDGPEPTGPLTWAGSPSPHLDDSGEVDWLMARRTRLVSTLRRLRPRLFHATYHLGTPRGSFVPRVVTCLDIVRLIRHQDYLQGRWAYRQLLRLAEAARFHSARRVITISQYTADDIMRYLGVPSSKIDVALLGVDLQRYRRCDETQSIGPTLERYGLTERQYFYYVGAADPRKNVDVMIAAFAQARVEGIELAVIGKPRPADQRAFDAAFEAAGSPQGVRFLGFVPEQDLPAIMTGGLGLLFCSTYEGFGFPAVEAMASGCPVIHTGMTSMAETVADAGLQVPARDIGATADAIRRLAVESGLHAQLREAGLKRAQRFSWKNTALATVDSYARALGL